MWEGMGSSYFLWEVIILVFLLMYFYTSMTDKDFVKYNFKFFRYIDDLIVFYCDNIMFNFVYTI